MANEVLKNQRGQAALENLANYSIALIIIMIVAVSIWRMGIFETRSQVERGMEGFHGLRVLDFRLVEEKKISISVANELSRPIRVQEVSTDSLGGGEESTVFTVFGQSGEILCDSTTLFVCPTFGAGEVLQIEPELGFILTPNDVVHINVEIIYQDQDSGLNHTSSGKVWASYSGT
ncbi:hypothetical protein ACFLRC_03450 [Candidatus Altiarchaeota archaeon]